MLHWLKHFCKLQHFSVFSEVSTVQYFILENWLLRQLSSQAVTNASIELCNTTVLMYLVVIKGTESQKEPVII